MSKEQIVNAPFLYVNGLVVSVTSTTALSVSAGICRDSTNIFDMTLASATAISSAVNGVNGLDTGTIAASTCYAVFVIADSSGFNATKTLISLSATAPVMPTGYDIFRRIGWAFTDGSSNFLTLWVSISGQSRQYFYNEPVSALSGGTQATFTAVALTNKVPAVDNLPVRLQLDLTPNAANDAGYIRTGGGSATNGMVMYGSVAAKKSSQESTVLSKLVISAPTIEYKVTTSGSLNALLLGFTDTI